MITLLQSLCARAIIEEKLTLHKQLRLKDIEISITKNKNLGHFQLNNAMKLAQILKKSPLLIAQTIKNAIQKNIKQDEITVTISKPGFINFTLKKKFLNKRLKTLLKNTHCKLKDTERRKIILDYSGPNIAKDMHVGHLRSTIIGECLSNILTYLGHKTIKINHLGDWGTQFGLLINYLKETCKDQNVNTKKLTLKILSNYYQLAQKKFSTDEKFKYESKKEVVKLQNENRSTINIWKKITYISKLEYKKIYSLLNIKIQYKGESFYKDLLKPIVEKLEKKKLITISQNAKCIYVNDFKNKNGEALPLIIKKSDGGFNYATTDLAALYYRIKYHKPDEIIYLTDVGQSNHFNMVFAAVEKFKINKIKTKLIHIPLGLMLNPDGKKIKTRSGKSEKLIDLLKNAITVSKNIIMKKNRNTKNINECAKIIGINTIKYADLSNKLDQNYTFDYKKIFQYNGNTASFLTYAYVRINGIKNKMKNIKVKNLLERHDIDLNENIEIELAIHLLQYDFIIKKAASDLNPNILTLYLYTLAEKFHTFFHKCNVINSKYKYSRIMICEIIRKILKDGLNLLGLTTLTKM